MVRVCIVTSFNKPVTLQAHRRLTFCEFIDFGNLEVYKETLAPGHCNGIWPIIPDGNTFMNDIEPFMTT